MKIGLDFDGTVTADKIFWRRFVELAKDFGHEVVITTYRSDDGDNADVEAFISECGIEVVYTDAHQKAHRAWNVDVWIDDKPELCPTFRELAGQLEFCLATKDLI